VRIRVYKRDDGPEDGHIFSPRGYMRDRPWMVGETPEDPRETCWRTWEEAMHYATDVPYRIKEVEDSAEPGW
jgi:hypothetical protein